MHLFGSKTEAQFREELAASRVALISGSARTGLRSVLQQYDADLSHALVVDWIPEQGEDIYEVLHGSEVLHLEIPHDGSSCAIQRIPLADYIRRRHSRPKRIKLAVALDMREQGPSSDAA